MFEIFKPIYFKKLPIKKVLLKLRVLSDASVLLKCRFKKQAPQKVLIELSPGVTYLVHNFKRFTTYFRFIMYTRYSVFIYLVNKKIRYPSEIKHWRHLYCLKLLNIWIWENLRRTNCIGSFRFIVLTKWNYGKKS